MSQNPSLLYAGLDLHKALLQLHLQGRDYALPNTPAGFRQLLRLLAKATAATGQPVQVICEASGGYERAVVAALHAALVPVSVLNPARARYFARAQGLQAKTDPIDARLLCHYGEACRPKPTPSREPATQQLNEQVRYRQQLLAKLTAERQQAAWLQEPALRRLSTALIKHLVQALAELDVLLQQTCQQSDRLRAQATVLTSYAGVGARTACLLLAEMPELGQLNVRQCAALAGLAPYTRQSGQWTGKASIRGGRAPVRKALYMAALTAIRHPSPLQTFYQRLRAAGKPAKVALTAAMRKLLIHLNALLKFHFFSLAT